MVDQQGRTWRTRGRLLVGTLPLVLAGCNGGPGPTQSEADAESRQSPALQSATDDRSNQEMKHCLEREGFLVTVGPGGRLDIESPEPGVTPREVIGSCQDDLVEEGLLPDPNAPPARADLEKRYEFMLGINDCMRDHGFPTEQPPSLDVYIEGDGLWHPYFVGPKDPGGMSPTPAVDFEVLQRECPER